MSNLLFYEKYVKIIYAREPFVYFFPMPTNVNVSFTYTIITTLIILRRKRFMLVPILLSVLWAICSTVLIQPWFWRGLIKRKTLIGNKGFRGFANEQKNELRDSIICQIAFGCLTLFVSLFLYLAVHVRYNLYGAIIPILIVLACQAFTMCDGWNQHLKIKTLIIIVIAVVCIFFSVTDCITSQFDVVGIAKSNEEVPIVVSTVKQNQEEKQPAFSSLSVASLFKASNDDVSGPVYSNGKFVYTITDSPNGYGIVIIDENDGETAKFIACNFKCKMSLALRQEYPSARIKILNVVISDDNVPFGKYAILGKPNMFGAPVLEKYVLQNMLTGEFSEYTAEALPEFAD